MKQAFYLMLLFAPFALASTQAVPDTEPSPQAVPVQDASESAVPERIVVLAFDAVGDAAPYRFGLATGVQRSLNVIGGVYVPPVGDTLLIAQRYEAQGTLDTEVFTEAFGARVLVSGLVGSSGDTVSVELIFAGPSYEETVRVPVEGELNDPAALLQRVVEAVIGELGLTLSPEDQAQVAAVTAQTPSLESLAAVAEASLALETALTPELQAAAERDSGSSWVLAERAEALAATGENDAALASSLQAIQAAPEDIEALVNRGVVLAATGDASTAREAFGAALTLNPAHAVALAGSARFAENPEAARSALEAALTSYPRYTAAYLELAALQRQTGAPQTALQTLRRGAEQVPESASLKAAFIGQAVRNGNADEAFSFLEAALAEAEPDPPPSLYALASAFGEAQVSETQISEAQSERALEIVREGRSRYPQDAALVLAEAEVLSGRGDDAGAEGVLASARAFAPENPEVANQLAITQARQGKTDEARATLEEVAAQNPQVGSVLERNLAQLYLEAGSSEEALATLEPLLERTPDDPDLYTLYGVALGRVGRFDQALNALDEALRLAPESASAQNARRLVEQNQQLTGAQRLAFDPNAAAVFGAGLSALEASELTAAQREFDRALELQSNAGNGAEGGLIAFYQGYVRQLQGDLRGAVQHYETALEGLPESATVLNNAGFAYFRLGRLDRAVDYLNRAVAADPDNSEAQLNLGLVYYDLGRYEGALAPLERALELRPELADTTVNVGAPEPLPLPELLERVRQGAE